MGLLDRPGQSQRYGLLSPDVMSLIQSGGPRVAQAPAAPRRERVSGWRVLDRVLGGQTVSEGLDAERARPAEEAARLQKQQVLANLMGMFGGGAGGGLGAAPAGGMPPIAPAGGMPGAQPGAAAAPARRGLPSFNEAAPLLMAGELAGIDGMAGIRSTLESLRPDVQVGPDGTTYDANDPAALQRRFRNPTNVNGHIADLNDTDNEGRYLPDLEPGEEPVYDHQGRIVGVRNMSGAIQARGERERATYDARNASEATFARTIAGERSAGSAPYEFVNVPTPSGAPAVISRQQAAGGIFQGQAPEDAIRAEGAARNEVAADETARVRASASARVLPSLDEMERRLPNVISGSGSGVRVAGARAFAALPLGRLNDGAERAATDTQVFQNEARQVVAGILPLFGANPTEGERKYAEQMSGADVSYTPESLREGIRLARARAARDAVAAGQPVPARLAALLPSGTVFIGEDGVQRRTR